MTVLADREGRGLIQCQRQQKESGFLSLFLFRDVLVPFSCILSPSSLLHSPENFLQQVRAPVLGHTILYTLYTADIANTIWNFTLYDISSTLCHGLVSFCSVLPCTVQSLAIIIFYLLSSYLGPNTPPLPVKQVLYKPRSILVYSTVSFFVHPEWSAEKHRLCVNGC